MNSILSWKSLKIKFNLSYENRTKNDFCRIIIKFVKIVKNVSDEDFVIFNDDLYRYIRI